jgi:hypothetical protein
VKERISGRASAKAARPKLQKILQRLQALKKREDKLGEVPQEEKVRLRKAYEKEASQINARFNASQMRFERPPGVFEELKDIGEKLQQLGNSSGRE